MKLITNISEWLNGKKTYIGVGLHAAWFVANIVFKDLTDSGQYWEGHGYIGAITGVGVGHKLLKTESGKKVTDSIKRAVKKD